MSGSSGPLFECLLSGFAGAIIAEVLHLLWDEYKRMREFHALLVGIVAECDYCLPIAFEIRDGSTNGHGSFKRMPIDYFRSIREKTIKYCKNDRLLAALARVCVDLELYNSEAEFILQHKNSQTISGTISAACQGVQESLFHLKTVARQEYNGGNE